MFYLFIFSCFCIEWNAHENAVFDIAWMEGEQMLVRYIKTDYHQNSVALLMGHFYIQVLNSNVFTYQSLILVF